MKLTGIIAISGKPGLYTVVKQSKNSVIVQNIETGRKMPAFAADRISALEDISIYTMEGDELLSSVFQSIFEKENGGEAISHKAGVAELQDYMREILADYDDERVQTSDIKKVYQWYNLLQKAGILKLANEAVSEEE